MLKVFHAESGKYFAMRLIDNLFFIAGGIFLLLGLFNSNTILSIYGLSVMFISLYALTYIYNYHSIGTPGRKDSIHNQIVSRLNELIKREKELQNEMHKNKKEIHRMMSRIQDEGYYHKMMTRLRAEIHANERGKRLINEDMRRVLLMLDHFIYRLPKEQKSAFMKSKNYKFYRGVIEKVK